MSRKKKELPLFENVTIADIAAEGKAVARVGELVVFVPYAIPGDVCDLKVTRKKNHYCEAVVQAIHTLSPLRVRPFCRHFGICGGCKWQNLSYEKQLEYKQKQVVDHLTRIGKVELPPIRPILGSRHQMRYRNKLEFGFSNKRWLTKEEVAENITYDNMNAVGFHIPGAFDKILDIDECWLMDDIGNRIRNFVRSYALEKELTFFDIRQQTGLLRNLMIRTSNGDGVMTVLQFHWTSSEEEQKARLLMQALGDKFPEISSLMYVNNLKCNDTIGDLDVLCFKGKPFLIEQMENLRFKVGPKSFYQTNTDQALVLYQTARDLAGLTGEELVYDLYTGTGTIANFVAHKARKVIGIEYVEEAIVDARENSKLNGIGNTLFYAGDMRKILNRDFVKEHGRPDVIITDPPRAGMHPDVVDTILSASPDRIVYVSCNSATQARDLQMLDTEYKVCEVQPVDMFPQTHHVENVVLLKKRNG